MVITYWFWGGRLRPPPDHPLLLDGGLPSLKAPPSVQSRPVRSVRPVVQNLSNNLVKVLVATRASCFIDTASPTCLLSYAMYAQNVIIHRPSWFGM